MMNARDICSRLTLAEKLLLVQGTDFMHTNAVPRLGVPSLEMADGPHGLRKQTGAADNGVSQSLPATAFPTSATAANSWDDGLMYEMGRAVGRECLHYGVGLLLGPGINIKRNPLCGRNFEYYSEDPYLTGRVASRFVSGLQSTGVGACVKHFAFNNQENYRFMGNSVVDERAEREIYLKAFETVVRDAEPAAVMCSYNRVNGEFCHESRRLLTDMLRGEWGFNGCVMTDWGGTNDRVKGLRAGLDLEMPGDTAYCRKAVFDAVENGTLDAADLDRAVTNVLNLVGKTARLEKTNDVDLERHNALAVRIAEDSAVLLKNDGALPLAKNVRVLFVGEMFEQMRYQGAGSSMINPTMLISPKDAADFRGIAYEYARGYALNTGETDDALLAQAVTAASGFETIAVFAGLTDLAESEGGDRADMRLPRNQAELIERLCGLGRQVILVLFGGSPVELPFADKAAAVLYMCLPGQGGGEAAARLLYGESSPSGKLAQTWPKEYADVPYSEQYSSSVNELYKESVFVGYRYFGKARVEPRYCFGHGLSYTSFVYSDLRVKRSGEAVSVRCTVANTGTTAGAETVQLYVAANPGSAVPKPEKELRAYAKTALGPGESKTVSLEFSEADLSYYNTDKRDWVKENGEYELQIAASYDDVRLRTSLPVSDGASEPSPYPREVTEAYAAPKSVSDAAFAALIGSPLPHDPPKLPLTMDSRFCDFRATFGGRILYGAVCSVAKKQLRRARKLPEGAQRDNKIKGAVFLQRIFDTNCVRSLSMSSGKAMPYNIAQGFVEIGNGRFLRGIAKMAKPYKIKGHKER